MSGICVSSRRDPCAPSRLLRPGVTIRCGSTPPSTRSTSVATVLSPQSSRCRPSSHKSPGSETGCSGAVGASSGSVRPSMLSVSSAPGEVESLQVAQLEAQQFIVPFCPTGRTVGEEAERFDLRVGQFIRKRHRDLCQIQLASSFEAQVPVSLPNLRMRVSCFFCGQISRG